jgi:hypothetical protein
MTMQSLWRTLTVVVAVLVLLAAGIPTVSAQGADPRTGTWKLNVAKSKFSPGPPPKSQTLRIEPAAPKGEKVVSEMVGGDGNTVKVEYTAQFDGKDYPVTGSPNADMLSLKRVNARTTERTDKKGGKTTLRYRRVVSADGKTMTVTVKGKNAAGETVNNTAVFEKQ